MRPAQAPRVFGRYLFSHEATLRRSSSESSDLHILKPTRAMLEKPPNGVVRSSHHFSPSNENCKSSAFPAKPSDVSGMRKRKLSELDDCGTSQMSPGKFYSKSPPSSSLSQSRVARSFDFSSANGSGSVTSPADSSGVDLLFASRKPLAVDHMVPGMNVKVKYDNGESERGQLLEVGALKL